MKEMGSVGLLVSVVLILALLAPGNAVLVDDGVPSVGDTGAMTAESLPAGFAFEWFDQFGTVGYDWPWDVHMDDTGVYMAGVTYGSLVPGMYAGNGDSFVRKYDLDGNVMWTSQFGSVQHDDVLDVWASGSAVYIVGSAYGALPGQIQIGGKDAYVAKLDAVDGSMIWLNQFGTALRDEAQGVIFTAWGLFVTGNTYGAFPGQFNRGSGDGFFARIDHDDGSLDFVNQFGTAGLDHAIAITGQQGSMDLALYIGGVTYGSFPGFTNQGGSDLFIQSANVKWGPTSVTQFGTTTSDWMETICEDDDKMLYVAGHTQGAFPGFTNKGRADGFVQKINPRNSEPDPKLPPKFYQPIWTDQFGTAEYDDAYALHVDGNSVYVGGETSGTLPDQVSNGESDTFLKKYDHSGNHELTYQFGSDDWEWVSGICGNDEDVYIVGETAGTMTGVPGYGESDCFIGKFDPSPKIFTTESPVDLGEVAVWDTITVSITVANLGLEYLIVEDMSLAETGSEYYTMGPFDPFPLFYGETETVDVYYHPWESGVHTTTVLITCEAPIGLVEVEITATAVPSEAPPDEQVEEVIDFADDEVSEGNLEGLGGGNSADEKLGDFMDKFNEAMAYYEDGDIENAFGTLMAILKFCDGDPKPPDHVTGEAAEELVDRIMDCIEVMKEELAQG